MSANPSMMKTTSMQEPLSVSHDDNADAHQAKLDKSIEYRIVYMLVFIVCLAITGLCRLLPRNRHPWICAGDDGSCSLWSEARSAADSTVPYVFQQ